MRTIVFLAVLVAICHAQYELECPFPEGQDVMSEVECNKYSACTWDGSACWMDVNGAIGYTVLSDPTGTVDGFVVDLQMTDTSRTMFGADIQNLVLEVIYHENYHVQIKIVDPLNSRYEVPVPLNLPDMPELLRLYNVTVSEVGTPFELTINRLSTGTAIFSIREALTYEDQFIQLTTSLPSSYLYGFGENTHQTLRHVFDPRTTWPIFTRDQAVVNNASNEYGHHPYYSVVEDDEGNTHSALFFNSNAMEYSTFLLSDGSPALTLRTIGGIIDMHFFLGPTPEDTNVQYAGMIGIPEFPPYWALGFHLSRWGYNNTDHVRLVRDRIRAAGIPQDVQTCDIDYMDRYRDFTYDPINWGDLPTLIEELHSENIKVTLPLDPAVVIDFENYEPVGRGRDVDAFVKWMSPDLVPGDQPNGTNDYMVGYVWPDTKVIFPDFLKPETTSWWDYEVALFHQKLDYDMIWLDMNEPANFGTDTEKPWNWPEGMDPWSLKCPNNTYDSPPYPTSMIRVGVTESGRISDHSLCMSAMQTDNVNTYLMYDTHSIYGWSETRATYQALNNVFENRRQTILSRSTFPGSGQYTIHWQGDNTADWPLLKMSIIGLIEFNMFGIPMVGSDICGFYGIPTEELCARWMELGAFYTFSRNHNAQGLPDQDPAVWPVVAQISRDVLNLRYKYLPYLYTLFHRSHMHGNTVIRGLFNVFPTDLAARDVDDQFTWGQWMMIAPVIEEGAASRDVYFPDGNWYDLVSGELVSSAAGVLNVDAPLEKIPVFARGGGILATQAPAITTTESRRNPFGLTIALDASNSASGELYWDDGTEYHIMANTFLAVYTYANGELTTEIRHDGTTEVIGLVFDNVVFYGFPSTPTTITVNGVDLAESDWSFDQVTSVLNATINEPIATALSIVIV